MNSEPPISDTASTVTSWDGEGTPPWTGQKQVSQYSSHDPACDQCRIKKIRCGREQPKCFNCQRSGFVCGFSDRGKRRNQTKQLLSEFERVELRLSRIEEAVGNCSAAIEGLPLGSAQITQPKCACSHDDSGFNTPSPSVEERDDGIRQPRRPHHIVMGEDGDETFYGPWSTVALFSEAREAIDRVTPATTQSPGGRKRTSSEAQDDFVSYTTQVTEEIMRTLTMGGGVDMSEDGQPIGFPPRGLLDASIDPFFRQINSIFPIFSRESFCRGIDRLYSVPSSSVDCALPVSYNNVILQVLSSKPKPFDRTSNGGLHAGSMDAELLKPFLMQSRRAFARLDQLLKLRLANVQALLTLCLIAQANFQLSLAELLLHQACDVAKRMGLHQQLSDPSNIHASAQAEERKNVFWTLFVLDKSMSLMTGHSCSLPSYDCDVPLPEVTQEYPLHPQFLARIRMARIQEQIHKNLYAVEASRKTDAERRKAIVQMDAELRDWWNLHKDIIRQEKIDGAKIEDLVGAELSFCFYNSRIMVHRAGSIPGRKSECLDDARACIAIMEKMNMARGSIAGSFVLRRLFQCYPFTGFFEVFSKVLSYQPQGSPAGDIASLRSVVTILGDLCISDQPSSYCTRLQSAANACTEIATRYIRYVDDCDAPSSKRSSRAPSRANTPPPNNPRLGFSLSANTPTSTPSAFPSSRTPTLTAAAVQPQGMFSPPLSEHSRDECSPDRQYSLDRTDDRTWLQDTPSSLTLSDAGSEEYFGGWMNGNSGEQALEEIMALL